jgi:hypothetical protein
VERNLPPNREGGWANAALIGGFCRPNHWSPLGLLAVLASTALRAAALRLRVTAAFCPARFNFKVLAAALRSAIVPPRKGSIDTTLPSRSRFSIASIRAFRSVSIRLTTSIRWCVEVVIGGVRALYLEVLLRRIALRCWWRQAALSMDSLDARDPAEHPFS